MRFRAKLTITMVLLLSLTYGIGGSLMIAQSFSSSIARERDTAVQTYRMVVDVLDLLGDNASPGTAANTVALVLHKLGSGGSSTAARIRFGAQMTTTGDTALLDEAPEPPAGSGVTSIVHTGNGRHYLMLGATADGTTVDGKVAYVGVVQVMPFEKGRYTWRAEGDNRGMTKKIQDRWYYFEAWL